MLMIKCLFLLALSPGLLAVQGNASSGYNNLLCTDFNNHEILWEKFHTIEGEKSDLLAIKNDLDRLLFSDNRHLRRAKVGENPISLPAPRVDMAKDGIKALLHEILAVDHVKNRKMPYLQGLHQIAYSMLHSSGILKSQGSRILISSGNLTSSSSALFVNLTDRFHCFAGALLHELNVVKEDGYMQSFERIKNQLKRDITNHLPLYYRMMRKWVNRGVGVGGSNFLEFIALKATVMFIDVLPLSFQSEVIKFYEERGIQEARRILSLALARAFLDKPSAMSQALDTGKWKITDCFATFEEWRENAWELEEVLSGRVAMLSPRHAKYDNNYGFFYFENPSFSGLFSY